jgi:hypothetical protein
MPDLPSNPEGGPRELAVPPVAAGSAGAVEVLRAWIVDGALHVTLDPAFPTPDTWGLLLADVARQAARAFAAEDQCGEREALSRIEWAMEAELENPTDTTTAADSRKQ